MYYMDKSIGTTTGAFMTSHFKSTGVNIELVPPLCTDTLNIDTLFHDVTNLIKDVDTVSIIYDIK